jgi:hypothetical protein
VDKFAAKHQAHRQTEKNIGPLCNIFGGIGGSQSISLINSGFEVPPTHKKLGEVPPKFGGTVNSLILKTPMTHKAKFDLKKAASPNFGEYFGGTPPVFWNLGEASRLSAARLFGPLPPIPPIFCTLER